jgi:hypothetical protein
MEPVHRELRQARVKMGGTIRGYGKNKARGLPSHRPPRKEAGVLMECGQPSLFLYLSIFKSEGLISYK